FLKYTTNVRTLINEFANGNRKMVPSNTPEEFIMLCGIIAYGACAATYPGWREDAFELLSHYACNTNRRIREGAIIAYQRLLTAEPQESIPHLFALATEGSHLQQCTALPSIAESPRLYEHRLRIAGLKL